MGVIKRGLLGGFSGRVGNIVGSSWKGIAVIKSLPLSVANPKTAAQVAQRSDFSDTVAFATKILANVIKPLWDRFASQMSGYNAFIQKNIGLVSDVADQKYDSFITSVGKMAPTPIDSVDSDSEAETVTVNWVDDADEGLKLASDIAVVVVSINDGTHIEGFKAAILRSELGWAIPVDFDLVTGQKLTVWLSFMRADGTVVSTSSVATAVIT